jgi:hypothetical protein
MLTYYCKSEEWRRKEKNIQWTLAVALTGTLVWTGLDSITWEIVSTNVYTLNTKIEIEMSGNR